MRDVLIIGGGIVGCLVALECHARGQSVTVIDAGLDRPGASWAGGGILSPMFPWRYSRALNALAETGNEAYAALSARLQAEGFMDDSVFYRSGIWMELAADERATFEDWASYTRQQFHLESRLIGDVWREGVAFPLLGSIRSDGMMCAVRSCLRSLGVEFCAAVASGWQVVDDRVEVALQRQGAVSGQALVIAAGAWSSELLCAPVKQFPAKGEMLMYRLGSDAPTELVLGREGYAIPRRNGDTLIGSTMRIGDSSSYPTVPGRRHLEAVAETLLPQCRGRKPGCGI